MAFTFAKNENQEFENTVIKDKLYKMARFKAYKAYTRKSDSTERLVWTFEVKIKDEWIEIPGFTSVKFGVNPKNNQIAKARKWAAALQGKKPTDEDLNHDLDSMIGLPCQLKTTTMGEGESAQSVVDDILPLYDEDEDEDDAAPAEALPDPTDLPF